MLTLSLCLLVTSLGDAPRAIALTPPTGVRTVVAATPAEVPASLVAATFSRLRRSTTPSSTGRGMTRSPRSSCRAPGR